MRAGTENLLTFLLAVGIISMHDGFCERWRSKIGRAGSNAHEQREFSHRAIVPALVVAAAAWREAQAQHGT